jgi:RNA polymerase sigma factor (sigma-70 family)
MGSQKNTVQVTEQEITVQLNSPWLQINGKHTPEDHLKILTSSWDTNTWEHYLKWFEDQNGQRAESILPLRQYDGACETQRESIFVYGQSSADDELKQTISKYLMKLTERQRRVIELIFWEGRSERFVAKTLSISQPSVQRLRKRALNKIKGLLKGGVSSRIMGGEFSPLAKGEPSEKADLSLAKGNLPKAS